MTGKIRGEGFELEGRIVARYEQVFAVLTDGSREQTGTLNLSPDEGWWPKCDIRGCSWEGAPVETKEAAREVLFGHHAADHYNKLPLVEPPPPVPGPEPGAAFRRLRERKGRPWGPIPDWNPSPP